MDFSLIKEFFLSFIPLFVAIDALGAIPIFLSLTSEVEKPERDRLVRDACATALIISVLFLVGGASLFAFLGITENDFRVAGGLVLLILAINDLIFSQLRQHRQPESTVGIVPIGIPLIMGPAALTTILIVSDAHGFPLTLASILLNLLFTYAVFLRADRLSTLLGAGGSRALAKVMALFLAAIGVMMVRVGLTAMLAKGAG